MARRRSTRRGSEAQLGASERGQQVAHAVVEADLDVLVVGHRLAGLRGQVARPGHQLGVVAHEHARRRWW